MKRTNLSFTQRTALAEWMKANLSFVKAESREVVADKASIELRFVVTLHNVKSIELALGIIKREKKKPLDNDAIEARFNAVVEVVKVLVKGLKLDPDSTEEIRAIFGSAHMIQSSTTKSIQLKEK